MKPVSFLTNDDYDNGPITARLVHVRMVPIHGCNEFLGSLAFSPKPVFIGSFFLYVPEIS
jgi:hypothetical protein